jgi:hypothetical protein
MRGNRKAAPHRFFIPKKALLQKKYILLPFAATSCDDPNNYNIKNLNKDAE